MMFHKVSAQRAMELIDEDNANFHVQDNGAFVKAEVNGLTRNKQGGTAEVTMETGEIRVIQIGELYA